MIAHFNTKQNSLSYPGYIRDNESQQSPDSPADRAEQQEEFVVGVLVSQGAITAEAESMNEYVSPDGAGEDVEEDPQERGYDVNIASVYLREMNTVPLLTRKREIEVAKRILADHYDVYLKKENPCSRTVEGHYELDPFQYWAFREPYRPMGAVDGKVMDSDMAEQLSFWGRWGSSSGMPFEAGKFLTEHIQWNHLEGYLKDRPSQPLTPFSAGETP